MLAAGSLGTQMFSNLASCPMVDQTKGLKRMSEFRDAKYNFLQLRWSQGHFINVSCIELNSQLSDETHSQRKRKNVSEVWYEYGTEPGIL